MDFTILDFGYFPTLQSIGATGSIDSLIIIIYGIILIVATYFTFRYKHVDRLIPLSLLIMLGRGFFLFRLLDALDLHNVAITLDAAAYRLPFYILSLGLLIAAIYITINKEKN